MQILMFEQLSAPKGASVSVRHHKQSTCPISHLVSLVASTPGHILDESGEHVKHVTAQLTTCDYTQSLGCAHIAVLVRTR